MIAYNILKLGFGFLFLVGIAAGFVLSYKIQAMLKEFNPQIWSSIGGSESLFKNSIKNSLACRKIVKNPPAEITHKPLLRLFLFMKMLDGAMLVLFIGMILLNWALSR